MSIRCFGTKPPFYSPSPSHSSAIRLLDEFLQSGGERLIVDPLKRAVFQHDLWALFDWLAARLDHHPDARKALLSRVARVIRRVALTQNQIEGLPDNYQQAVRSKAFASSFDPAQRERAFLPPDLTAGNGQWLAVSANDPVAAQHASEISHSSFSVKWHVPGGAPATLAYWKALWDHPEPYVIEFDHDGERRVTVNPALPAIPSGTQLALVRRMLLIDQRGVIVPSAVTENVQFRVLQQQGQHSSNSGWGARGCLPVQAGGLQAVAAGDLAFFTFSSHGIDPFELPPDTARQRPPKILEGCGNCHQQSRSSIHVVLSLRRLLKPVLAARLESSPLEPLVHSGCRRCGPKSATCRLGAATGILAVESLVTRRLRSMLRLQVRSFRQEVEEDRDDQVDGEKLHSLEPVAFAIPADLGDDPHRQQHRRDLRQRELQVHRLAEDVGREYQHRRNEERNLHARADRDDRD